MRMPAAAGGVSGGCWPVARAYCPAAGIYSWSHRHIGRLVYGLLNVEGCGDGVSYNKQPALPAAWCSVCNLVFYTTGGTPALMTLWSTQAAWTDRCVYCYMDCCATASGCPGTVCVHMLQQQTAVYSTLYTEK